MEKIFSRVNRKRILRFFGPEDLEHDMVSQGDSSKFVGIAEKLPKNFNLLFAFAGKKCKCHNRHLTWRSILSHNGIDFEKWM